MNEPVTGPRYTMYGASFSHYSAKLRSYLRCKDIEFEEITPSLRTYRRFIQPRTGVRYIPVLHTPEDEVLQDTAVIIRALEPRFPTPPAVPAGVRRGLAAELLELFGDEWLLLPAMHYRWNFPEANRPWLNRQFGGLAFPRLPGFAQAWLGARIGQRFHDALPHLGLTERTAPALETWFDALLDDLDAHLAEHPFLLGGAPTVADYGCVAAFAGHLFGDPHPKALFAERIPNVHAWVTRLQAPVEGATAGDEDDLPATLMPLLNRVGTQMMPVLHDAGRQLDEWARRQPPGAPVPRSIGTHKVRIAGQPAERSVQAYPLWRLQNIRDRWLQLEGERRASADRLLEGIGAIECFTGAWRARLVRHANRLYLADREQAPRMKGIG
ncbi:MAG: glutathione S-transferase [Xanthomonadales bacterium]|nr:glutathione S-transferase [Xanthomonadales bacterium]